MTFRTSSLRVTAMAVCAREGVDVTGLPVPELLELSGHVARLRRDADVLMAVVAAEIRRRSEAVEVGAGLAMRQGFRSAGDLVAQTTGGSLAEARRLMAAGDLLAEAESVGVGEPAGESVAAMPGDDGVPAHMAGAPGGMAGDAGGIAGDTGGKAAAPGIGPTPMARFRADLALAVGEGRIGIDAASLFTDAMEGLPGLSRVLGPAGLPGRSPEPGPVGLPGLSPEPGPAGLPEESGASNHVTPPGGMATCDTERTRALFSMALDKAQGLPLNKVRALVWRAQALADPEAWEAREERQHQARSLTVRDDADGMVVLTARLTPLAAAPVKAVLDAGVRSALQARRDDPATDPRTVWQIRADLLTDLCRHAQDCRRATSGVKTTVVVRMTLADLRSGAGTGEIDGMAQPVSVSALRQAAADAEIIPAVLGGPSEILDWGRTRRLFTSPQRLALVERDGGCAWCNAPPSWCAAHHIQWWERDAGPTDLDNAVLLCSGCHHRLHRDNWEIDIQDSTVRFIPPPSVDPTRTPRVGGRERYALTV